jgi:hypothetical protein
VAVARVDSAAEPVRFGGALVFQLQAGKNALVCFGALKVVKLTHATVLILEREKI